MAVNKKVGEEDKRISQKLYGKDKNHILEMLIFR